MKPSQLQRLLTTAFRHKLKVLIKGAPGIGKTEIVMQACAAAGAALIVMHPAVSDPTDFKGLPAIVEKHAEFLPYGQLRKLIEATTLTVCFIDDIGQAPHAVQAALMQLIQQREIDGHRISDQVVFCGATNDNSHMAGVQSILEPVKSRWHTIVELVPDQIEWVRWAKKQGLAEEVLAFVMFRGMEALSNFKATRELTNSPSPRTVANAAALFSAGLASTISSPVPPAKAGPPNSSASSKSIAHSPIPMTASRTPPPPASPPLTTHPPSTPSPSPSPCAPPPPTSPASPPISSVSPRSMKSSPSAMPSPARPISKTPPPSPPGPPPTSRN